jgi:hypothetical protein
LELRTLSSLPKPPLTLEDPRAGGHSDPIEPAAVDSIANEKSSRLNLQWRASSENGIAGREVCVELPRWVAFGLGMGVALSDFRKMVTIGCDWNVRFAPKNCLE